MRQLVPGMVEGGLQVRHAKPSVPDRESPVPYDSSVGFEGGIERATGAVGGEEGENRVPSSSGGRGSHRNLNPGVVQAGV